MAELRGDLSLDTTDAESSIEQLSPLFDEVTSGFSSALAETLEQLASIPPPDIDTSQIETALAESGTSGAEAISDALSAVEVEPLDVTVDTASAEAQIAELDAPAIEATVDLDTSEATAALDDLGSSAQDAVGGTSALGGSVDGLSAAQGLATGNTAALGGAIDGLAGKVGIAGGVMTGAAGIVGVFFNEATDALGATQRFESQLGSFADSVNNLENIKGLNTDLSTLALQLGSDDDKIRNVASRLFQLADASGVAGEDASVFVQQMVAMGARAVALNPELGDVGDVTDSLSTALVRGGRFASKYGLDLNQAEIQARALNDTGKQSVDQLSFVEKAMAGAAIASEKYGGDLEEVIAKGSENAVTKQRALSQQIRETIESLGAPLVAPIFELMEGAQPVVQAVGLAFSRLAQAVIPVLVSALDGLVPLFELLATVLEVIPPDLLLSAVAFTTLMNAAHPILAIIAALLPLLNSIDESLVKWIVTLVGAVAGTYALVNAFKAMQVAFATNPFGLAIVGAGLLIGALGLLGGSTSAASQETQEFTDALIENAGALDDNARAAARSILEEKNQLDDLARAGVKFADVTAAVNKANEKQVDVLSDLQSKQITVANNDAARAAAVKEAADALRSHNPELARLLVQLEREGELNPGLINTIKELSAAQVEANETQKNRNKTGAEDVDIKQEQTTATEELMTAEEAAAQAVKAVADATTEGFDRIGGSAQANLPTVVDLFDQATKNAEKFGVAASPQQLLDDLNAQVEAVRNFTTNIQLLYDAGLDNVAALVISKGPAVGGAFAQQVLDGNIDLAHALNDTIGLYADESAASKQILSDQAVQSTQIWRSFHEQFPSISFESFGSAQEAYKNAAAVLSTEGGLIGAKAAEEYGKMIGTVPGQTDVAFDQAGNAITSSDVPAKAGTSGAQAAAAFGGSVQTMDDFTHGALAGVAGVFDNSFSIVGSPAHIAGLITGQQFGQGIINGMESFVGRIRDEAARLVNQAEDAARDASDSHSPSRLFMKVGTDMGEGIAIGFADAASDAVSTAEQIVRDAALALSGGTGGGLSLGLRGGIGGGSSSSEVNFTFKVDVHGVSDTATARAVGQEIAESAAAALTRRRIVVAARTGGVG